MKSEYQMAMVTNLFEGLHCVEMEYPAGLESVVKIDPGIPKGAGLFRPKSSRRIKTSNWSCNLMSIKTGESIVVSSNVNVATEKFRILLDDAHAQRHLNRMLQTSNYSVPDFVQSVSKYLDDEFRDDLHSIEGYSQSKLQLLFALSAIQDLISWGSSLDIIESQLWLTKTKEEINNNQNAGNLRGAMTSLKTSEISYFAPITQEAALDILKEGKLQLELVSPKNIESSEIFRHGVTTWSMPYRGREGRSARFIVWIVGNDAKYPLGIMEVGDDAPYSPLRDQALGFSVPDQKSPLNEKLKDRLFELRKTMINENLPIDPSLALEDFKNAWENLSLDEKSVRDSYSDGSIRKRLGYLNRIFQGELALSPDGTWNERDIAAAIRAIKDVTLNRVHTEVVICGALPPFGNLLGGKIVAMMMNHPLVRATLDRDIGILLAGSFDRDKIEGWLPRFGPLLTTTKGLFPNHSAQYNRVRIPVGLKSLKLDKLGLTQGQTMSHISDRTMSFAVEINLRMGEKGVSREYGSGGAKRQRILQSAARVVGLDANGLYADVTRPVYGCLFLSNSQGVVLGGETPEWKDTDMPFQDSRDYEDAVLRLWRDKWLRSAVNRQQKEGK
jgi:hypothetical protein